MAVMRAKMQLNRIELMKGSMIVHMNPVTGGNKEDNSYSKYTPSGSLSLQVTNESLFDKLTVGDVFYVDFTKVE